MKPKISKYLLIAGVALVWGLIIYRVVSGFDNDGPAIPIQPITNSFEQVVKKDSFTLIADYPDPFLGDEEDILKSIAREVLPVISSEPQTPAPVTEPPQPEDISFIQYKGMIVNSETKAKAAIVGIREAEYVLRENEQSADIILKIIEPFQITIIYKKKKYRIPKQNS
jgi:hypothetical protein